MFSVIIPAYNAAAYIQNAIDSVLEQTVGEYEIIVVDDGSSDDTSAVVNRNTDVRIRCIRQENSGVSAARNVGIQNAKGDYICFLDADDLWKPYHLEVVSNLISNYPTASVYLTGHEIRLNNGINIKRNSSNVSENIQSDNIFKVIWESGYFIHTNSVVCKTSVFSKVGFFEVGIKNGEDDDMWYRLFAYCSVAISNEVTTIYIRENSRATAKKIFVDDWIFLHRVKEIMESSKVSIEKKEYLCRLLEQRKISEVRHCILNKEKKTAWKKFRQINIKKVKIKKYIETLVALLFPSTASICVYTYRNKNYFRK